MSKCFHFEMMVMDGSGPVERRPVVSICTEFSCELERALHLVNRDLLTSRKLGWSFFDAPRADLQSLFRRSFMLHLEGGI